MKIKFLI